MTNEEAIKHLEFLKIAGLIDAKPNRIDTEALDLAIDVIREADEVADCLTKSTILIRKLRRPRGHWQVIGYHADKYFYCKCSNCQKKTKVFYDKTNPGEFGSLADIKRNVNFCMFCGADMREATADE